MFFILLYYILIGSSDLTLRFSSTYQLDKNYGAKLTKLHEKDDYYYHKTSHNCVFSV